MIEIRTKMTRAILVVSLLILNDMGFITAPEAIASSTAMERAIGDGVTTPTSMVSRGESSESSENDRLIRLAPSIFNSAEPMAQEMENSKLVVQIEDRTDIILIEDNGKATMKISNTIGMKNDGRSWAESIDGEKGEARNHGKANKVNDGTENMANGGEMAKRIHVPTLEEGADSMSPKFTTATTLPLGSRDEHRTIDKHKNFSAAITNYTEDRIDTPQPVHVPSNQIVFGNLSANTFIIKTNDFNYTHIISSGTSNENVANISFDNKINSMKPTNSSESKQFRAQNERPTTNKHILPKSNQKQLFENETLFHFEIVTNAIARGINVPTTPFTKATEVNIHNSIKSSYDPSKNVINSNDNLSKGSTQMSPIRNAMETISTAAVSPSFVSIQPTTTVIPPRAVTLAESFETLLPSLSVSVISSPTPSPYPNRYQNRNSLIENVRAVIESPTEKPGRQGLRMHFSRQTQQQQQNHAAPAASKYRSTNVASSTVEDKATTERALLYDDKKQIYSYLPYGRNIAGENDLLASKRYNNMPNSPIVDTPSFAVDDTAAPATISLASTHILTKGPNHMGTLVRIVDEKQMAEGEVEIIDGNMKTILINKKNAVEAISTHLMKYNSATSATLNKRSGHGSINVSQQSMTDSADAASLSGREQHIGTENNQLPSAEIITVNSHQVPIKMNRTLLSNQTLNLSVSIEPPTTKTTNIIQTARFSLISKLPTNTAAEEISTLSSVLSVSQENNKPIRSDKLSDKTPSGTSINPTTFSTSKRPMVLNDDNLPKTRPHANQFNNTIVSILSDNIGQVYGPIAPTTVAPVMLSTTNGIVANLPTIESATIDRTDESSSIGIAIPKGPTKTFAVGNATWPVKHSAIVEGDVILGGLMMVHSREDTITCGPIMPQGGIQALEVMLFTLDRINEAGFLPNISLGAHILDDCDKDTYGLEMAVDFIKGESIFN